VAPGVQVYDTPPVDVSVALLPTQMLGEDELTFTVGTGLTVRATVLEVRQPKIVAPVTVYIVEAAGLTVTPAPESEPGLQLYETAPEEDRLLVNPGQIAVGDATAVKVGPLLTVTVSIAKLSQLFVFPVRV
jgi:hypothetical protein